MTIAEMVLEKLRHLPPDKQKIVLDFLASLETLPSGKHLRSLEGLWGDFGIEISEKEIGDARREMWSNFPREIS
jgi:hypothetical protein